MPPALVGVIYVLISLSQTGWKTNILVTWINIALLERCLCLMHSTRTDEMMETTMTISVTGSSWVCVLLRFDVRNWLLKLKIQGKNWSDLYVVRYSKYDLRESRMESASSPSPSRGNLPLKKRIDVGGILTYNTFSPPWRPRSLMYHDREQWLLCWTFLHVAIRRMPCISMPLLLLHFCLAREEMKTNVRMAYEREALVSSRDRDVCRIVRQILNWHGHGSPRCCPLPLVPRCILGRVKRRKRNTWNPTTHILANTYPTTRPLWSSATNDIWGHVIAWYIPGGKK